MEQDQSAKTFDAIRRWSRIGEKWFVGKVSVWKPLMPLGVDHGNSFGDAFTKFAVRKPLMPLGVDHPIRKKCWRGVSGAKTFDAIRRWSQWQETLSSGVTWVRKPLMPLGVDHNTPLSRLSFAIEVRKPLMPLGVDHTCTLFQTIR